MSYQGYGNGNGGGYGNGGYGGGGYGNSNGNGYGNSGYGGNTNSGYGGGNQGYGGSGNASYGGGGYGDSYRRLPQTESGMEMRENPRNNYGQQEAIQSYGQPAAQSQPAAQNDNELLDQCFAIDQAITDLESRLSSFQALQTRVLSDRASYNELDAASADILSGYRALAQRMKKIKQKPASGSSRNAPQVGRVDRRLKSSMTDFQKVEADFRAKIKEQQARQYRIVKPNASDAEVAEAVDAPDAQIFQQALINSDRRGQAQSTLNAVRQRNAAIQNIERSLIELAEMFQDMDNLVMEQDVMVKQIEEKAEQAQEDVTAANVELDKGIASARGARRKKWCLFWFIIILLLIVAIVVVVYIEINKSK